MPATFGHLSSRIFLWSMQRVCSNVELASFWFRHYAALGIHMRTHAHIVVHATSVDETARARRFLHEHNVSHITFVQEFSSAIKTAMVNAFIRNEIPHDGWLPELTRTPRSLRAVRTGYAYQPPACCTYRRRRAACPEAPRTVRTPYAYQPRACRTYRVPWHGRWLLYADADEFFSYPLDVVRLLRHSPALCSSMVDRLSSDLTVPRVRHWAAGASLPMQFPLCAPLRQRIAPGGGWMKLTLLRARIRGAPPAYINTHVALVNATRRLLRFGGNGRQRCTYTGSFSHYMHSEQGYAVLRDKLALYERTRRMINLQVYRAHLALVEKSGATGGRHRFTAAAARLIGNLTTACPET